MHRTKDVRPAASLDTSQPPPLISGLADGYCATAVHDRAIAPLVAIAGLRSNSFVIGCAGGDGTVAAFPCVIR